MEPEYNRPTYLGPVGSGGTTQNDRAITGMARSECCWDAV